jgi:ABC-type multidrug transport system fused ATPase/permease subunit
MEKDQSGIAQNAGLDHSPGQEPTTTAVEEYLNLAEGSRHLRSGETGKDGNNTALFKDVSVWGVDAGLTYQESVATAIAAPARLLYALLSQNKSTKKVVLHGIDGIVHEGEMLLALGRPGAGCTTLLKTLAGMTDSFHGWSGVIEYLGVPIDDIKKSYRGDVVYNAEGMFILLGCPE